jgi:hypothetical protein
VTPLFKNDGLDYSPEALRILDEMVKALSPIFTRYESEHSVRELALLAHGATIDVECGQAMKIRLERHRAAKGKEPFNG